MFSDQIQKSGRFPQAGLLMAAGGLVIVCQLVAMAMVADKQVQRAGVRDLQRIAQQLAVADCIQRSIGPGRRDCLRQSQLESGGDELVVNGPADPQTFAIKTVAIAGDDAVNGAADMMRAGIAGVR